MASDTRQMADDDLNAALHAGGPGGRVVLVLMAVIVIAVAVWLLLR